MDLNRHIDLRGGRTCWRDNAYAFSSNALADKTDVLVIGAGIMGASVAERLAARGRHVTLVDRRAPGEGATAGSTALVMWAADVPLTRLARKIGASEAANRWRHVYGAVEALNERIGDRALKCAWRARPEVYLSGQLLDDDALSSEADFRQQAGLPSVYRDGDAIAERFQLPRRSALVSGGSYEVDPMALTAELLRRAEADGASLTCPIEIVRLQTEGSAVRAFAADGQSILAKNVVLATGYEPVRLFLPTHFKLSSSYAIASSPGAEPQWRENALIWEAASPYLYARVNGEGRIIIGGGDEEFVDPIERDGLIGQKSGVLQAQAKERLGVEALHVDCAWASTFGGSPDGLPAIGRARNMNNIWLAYGYGGNGVSFASLGASLIERALDGVRTEAEIWFSPYRFDGA